MATASPSPRREIRVYQTEQEVIQSFSDFVGGLAKDAIASSGVFTVGLSGGSMVDFLAKALPKLSTDWSKWTFFFCDERVVPKVHPDSTYGLYWKNLMGKINVKDTQFVHINTRLSAEAAARDYTRKLEAQFGKDGFPRFDLLLLGLGPDGHTCSLFPDHPLLEETTRWVAHITDSPKPPPSRVTFTYPLINNAKNAIFVILGAGKADIVKKIIEEKELLPAVRVQPTDGNLIWFLDREAASKI